MTWGRWFARTGGLAVAVLLAAATSASAEPRPSISPPTLRRSRFTAGRFPRGLQARRSTSTARRVQAPREALKVITTLTVTPGTAYDIYVGGEGFVEKGGYNGGGPASGGG